MDSCAARGDLQAQTDSPLFSDRLHLLACCVESPQSFFILPRPPFSLVRLETISIVYCFKSVRTFALILTFLLDCLIDLQIWILFFVHWMRGCVCVCVYVLYTYGKKEEALTWCSVFAVPSSLSLHLLLLLHVTDTWHSLHLFLVELPNCDSQRGFRMLLFDVLTLLLSEHFIQRESGVGRLCSFGSFCV